MIESSRKPLRILIVGAGLGGLTCAIACRQHGLDVVVLEKSPQLLPIGAGIQIPPNASRVLKNMGIFEKLQEKAMPIDFINMRRLLHRADYQDVLQSEARRLGAEIVLGAGVCVADCDNGTVTLQDQTVLHGDVVVGADGLWSVIRDAVLDQPTTPLETGDLAYRGTFTRQRLEELNDPRVEDFCKSSGLQLWFGPDKHCVFYPMRNGTEFNLVLVRPDDLPAEARTVPGDIEEMRWTFQGWDPVLTKIIGCIPSVLKWKLMHHEELKSWTKGRVALLGDACHPTLPYQAQGAAMAVEDGAILGNLLGSLNQHLARNKTLGFEAHKSIVAILKLYESLRKARTTTNVRGAVDNRTLYHLEDGPTQEARDQELREHTWSTEDSKWLWMDMPYQDDLLGVDIMKPAQDSFQSWLKQDGLSISKDSIPS